MPGPQQSNEGAYLQDGDGKYYFVRNGKLEPLRALPFATIAASPTADTASDAQIDRASARTGMDTRRSPAGKNSLETLSHYPDRVANLRRLYARGPGATSGVKGARDYLPLKVNSDFDRSAQQLKPLVGMLLDRPSGTPFPTPQAREDLAGSYLPQAKDGDTTILAKLDSLDELARRAGMPATRPAEPAAASDPASSGDYAVATGTTRTVPDAEANALLKHMARARASLDSANNALAEIGRGPVDPLHYRRAVRLFRNPKFDATVTGQVKSEPTTHWNQLAASRPAAALVGGLDGATAGFLDEGYAGANSLLTGTPYVQALANMNARKQAIADLHPLSYGAGNLAGTMLSMAEGGAALDGLGAVAKLGRFGRYAPAAGDLAFSALSGAGEDNEDRMGGALANGLFSLAGRGGVFGAKQLKKALVDRGRDAGLRLLADNGIGVPAGYLLGGVGKDFENEAAKIPVLGKRVAVLQNESIDGLNRAWGQNALDHIGIRLPDDVQAGPALHRFGENAFRQSEADARAGVSTVPAEQLALGQKKWDMYRNASARSPGKPGVAYPPQLFETVVAADPVAANQGEALMLDWARAAKDNLPAAPARSGWGSLLTKAPGSVPGALALPVAAGAAIGKLTGDTRDGSLIGGMSGAAAIAALSTRRGRAALEKILLSRLTTAHQPGGYMRKLLPQTNRFGSAVGNTAANFVLTPGSARQQYID